MVELESLQEYRVFDFLSPLGFSRRFSKRYKKD